MRHSQKEEEAGMPKAITGVICGVLWALILLVAAGPGGAWGAEPEWVLVDENPESYFYYDKSGVSRPREGIVRVTTRVVYTPEGKADTLELLKPAKGYEQLFETRFLFDLDCKERKSHLLRVTHLDGAGAQLKAFELAEATDWEAIPTAARIELVAESECGW